MTPPPALADSVVQGNPDRSHPSASAGGVVNEGGGKGAGRGRSPPSYVKPAIGIITFTSDHLLDDNHHQSYHDFLATDPHARLHGSPTRAVAGTGSQTKDTCGITRHWAACSKDKGHGAYPLLEHCDDPECPKCWTSWALKQSRKISERLRGYISAARPDGDTWFTQKEEDRCFQYYDPDLGKFWEVGHKENAQNVRHFVLSAPEGELDPGMTTARIHAIGKFWATWVGIKGGMMVFHPFRILPEIKQKLNQTCPRSKESRDENEKKHWQIIRENGLGLESWHSYIYWSPHFHIEGFGYNCDSVNFRELTGWVIKHVRDIDQRKEWTGQRMKDEVAATAYYLLSHCNIEWLKKSVMWIGCMTPLNLKRLKEKPVVEEYERVCKKCQAQEIVYEQTDQNVPGEPVLGNEGDLQWLYYREKLYRYHIVTGKEKDARREQRKRERETARKGTGPPRGSGLPEKGKRGTRN